MGTPRATPRLFAGPGRRFIRYRRSAPPFVHVPMIRLTGPQETNPKLLLKRVEQLKEEAKVAQKACKSSESIEVYVFRLFSPKSRLCCRISVFAHDPTAARVVGRHH